MQVNGTNFSYIVSNFPVDGGAKNILADDAWMIRALAPHTLGDSDGEARIARNVLSLGSTTVRASHDLSAEYAQTLIAAAAQTARGTQGLSPIAQITFQAARATSDGCAFAFRIVT